MTVPKLSNHTRRLLHLPAQLFHARQAPIARQIWRGLTLLSLALMGVGVYYAWRGLPPGGLAVQPRYLGFALGLYLVTYIMHTLGWHNLATYVFGPLPLRANARAVAGSNLVKYLPTIAWYIANRVHFYNGRGVSRKAVVAASLLELTVMIGTGSVLYALFWLLRLSIAAALLALLGMIGCGMLLRRQSWWHTLWQRYAGSERPASKKYLLRAVAWYGSSWVLAVGFLWLTLHAFAPVHLADLGTLFNIWLLAGLASYVISVTLGSLGVVRELTVTALLAPTWSLPAAIATAIAVKLILTLGEIACSGVVLGLLRIMPAERAHE